MTKLNIDCLSLVFNELQMYGKSLYSCLLVNREWCKLVVPILWKNHACISFMWGKKLFYIILSWLPSTSKQLLFDNDITLPPAILLKPPLFNYFSFCDFPETETIEAIIEMVTGGQHFDNIDKRNLL